VRRLLLVDGERGARLLGDDVAGEHEVRRSLGPVLRGDPAELRGEPRLAGGAAHLGARRAAEVEVGDDEDLS
jgi:hypothetical protein